MDKFGDDYVSHNLPLLILSGLEDKSKTENEKSGKVHTYLHEGGFRIKIDVPPIQSETATYLLEAFLAHDGTDEFWKAQSTSPRESRLFKIRSVGRTYTLPARKAPPPPHSPIRSSTSSGPPPVLVLHSPLSPLTPSSPLYPDGIISSLWITKHQSRLPCAFLTFFTLTSDANTSSLQDNKIKSEINETRATLASTNYKTKLVVILLADGEISLPEVEDRLANIRRATTLDLKGLYFVPFDISQDDMKDFTTTFLTSLLPQCIEYYRDLSKHARRKRNRSSIPQPTIPPTGAHVLSQQGWNVRYEFKLGVFAEFRQEVDAACRNYETAYENLLSPETIETIAAWNPRFNEARLLADIITIRIIRCLLWTGQSINAVKTWTTHRDKMQDLANRRGKGTEHYGWEAWQSIWSKTMVDLIARSDLTSLNNQPSPNMPPPIYAIPEKQLQADRAIPWEFLHHEGYWLDIAQKHIQNRRKWALQIPEEDRQPPGRSPASMIASKAHLYDTYLTSEPYIEVPVDHTPGYNYSDDIVTTLASAMKHFGKRSQLRNIEILELRQALEYLQSQSWNEAASILRSLWRNQRWRKAGWWRLLEQVGWALLECAFQLNSLEDVIPIDWELGCAVFDENRSLSNTLSSFMTKSGTETSRSDIAIDASQTTSRIIPSFVFVGAAANVGEPLECQFSLTSCSRIGTAPVELSEIKIVFEGSLKPIYLIHKEQENGSTASAVEVTSVALQDSSVLSSSVDKRSSAGAIASLSGSANLLLSPGQIKVFSLHFAPREAGDVSVASITLMMEGMNHSLTVTTSESESTPNCWWEIRNKSYVSRRIAPNRSASKVEVFPKPPKLELKFQDFKSNYYTNEQIELCLDIVNTEEETASVSIEARLISPLEKAARIKWSDDPEFVAEDSTATGVNHALSAREIGSLSPGSSTTLSLTITDAVVATDHELEIVARYTLESDQETIIGKGLIVEVSVIRPFEANYDFLPRLDQEPWPSLFEVPTEASNQSTPLGLKHQYLVKAPLYSFATEPLFIEAIVLTAAKVTGGAVCSSTTGILKEDFGSATKVKDEQISTEILPEETKDFTFGLSVQKLVLGDRHTVGIDLALEIGWRRPNSDRINTFILEAPRFVAPMAEPRVLLTIDNGIATGSKLKSYVLRFSIENPSMHFLSFNITMDSSEEFAFSGPKACALSLVPISRHELRYRILSNKKEEWIKVQLNVVDAYFGQTLKVQPAGDDVKLDKKGNVLVYVG